MPSIDQNLQPFTGNDDVSNWVKNSWVGRKTPNKGLQNFGPYFDKYGLWTGTDLYRATFAVTAGFGFCGLFRRTTSPCTPSKWCWGTLGVPFKQPNKKWSATTMDSGPQYIYILQSFCIFSRKLNVIFCIVCTFMLHNGLLASHIHSTLMIYKTKLSRGPLINSYSNRHLTPPLHLQLWIHMSAREYVFLFHALCVYRYNKEKFVRRKMY